MYLEEDSLQLSTEFSTILLGENDGVCGDAVVGHPAVPLQHPYHNVWKAVLRLDGRTVDTSHVCKSLQSHDTISPPQPWF